MPNNRRRRPSPTGLPKGAYRLPTGGYIIDDKQPVTHNGRTIRVVGIRREQPDLQRLARVFIEHVKAEQAKQRHDEQNEDDDHHIAA